MASPYKIPKKKQPEGSDSAHIHLLSPLSRLHGSAPQDFGSPTRRGGSDRMHDGKPPGIRATRQPFRSYVQTLLGLDRSCRGGALSANHGSAGSWSSQWQQRFSNCRGSSRRASGRLLQSEDSSGLQSPPQMKVSSPSTPHKRISVKAVDYLEEQRAQVDAGKLSSSPPQRKVDPAENGKEKKNSSSVGPEETSEDEFVSPSSSSSSSTMKTALSPKMARRRLRADQEDVMETQRRRWRTFRDRKTLAASGLRQKKSRLDPSEAIVLSSEEEEDDEGQRTSRWVNGAGHTEKTQVLLGSSPPSFLQLEFCSLHSGLMEADARGAMKIAEYGITFPVKGTEDTEVTVVASQLRGYGVWDGGVAMGGALLAGWKGPAPSLLFLWVSAAQANLLQRELSLIQKSSSRANAPPCSFLLLMLKEQLSEMQAALLASILDTEEYHQHRSSSSPIDWSQGLLLLHSCPAPLDRHLLRLLGHSAKPGQSSAAQRNSAGQQPTRLIQYPLVPCIGRMTLTQEDLDCLDAGEFLNDVIIDFYLKYLLLEGVGGTVAQRSHVFSSFFYKQLSCRRAAGESDAPSVPDHHTRHQRVKTWTRDVDIFSKDFLFVPVNKAAHWFLVVVCFPGLEDVRTEEFLSGAGGSERAAAEPRPRSQLPPLRVVRLQCSLLGCQKKTVTKRPCILVMDSLKLSSHDDVCRLIRGYLQVEWEVRRKTRRLFAPASMRSCTCSVPQQDNGSDCGVYLLQFAESFLQNPVVDFDPPLRLEGWFPRQQARQKRNEIRSLLLRLERAQLSEQNQDPEF
ncbi:sentrin-specific protease 7-like isoform X4 [Xiphophorus hellerii]|nr:sentrin-specific protease 7-like isoform X4 [Xiphophorus hellerii]XP_032412104.1 sentrin-specific protease 7-like isoform X4 [Xiphophorus hellerii]XP_032412105.1 sentrin-specific protease 7-like isoform X4 [Xiphophorus hellerii]